jgi:hypothetical protein
MCVVWRYTGLETFTHESDEANIRGGGNEKEEKPFTSSLNIYKGWEAGRATPDPLNANLFVC